MPKAPIQRRTRFYRRLSYDKSIQMLDWNAVDTELGPMIEPHSFSGGYGVVKVTDVDVYDSSINQISEITDADLRANYGTWGEQLPVDFSPQGA